MLQTLAEAKAYATDRIAQLTERELPPEEKFYIEDLLEETFMEKISQLVSEEELEKSNATTIEELEGWLFYHLPNYITLLEDTTAEFMANYLLDDETEEDDIEDEENAEEEQKAEIS
ncbi:MAG: hypothetical protein LBP53_01100 [Candidatus Peribacteria bacterium]|jgi:hypothetical protein|nr:hypothetical protein [Candidatus Peribacteria bacterium]